jgi:hypothetical protein
VLNSLHDRVEAYWAVSEAIREHVFSSKNDDAALSKIERRMERLEVEILAAKPLNREQLLLKMEFIGRLILESSAELGPTAKLLTQLKIDIEEFLAARERLLTSDP